VAEDVELGVAGVAGVVVVEEEADDSNIKCILHKCSMHKFFYFHGSNQNTIKSIPIKYRFIDVAAMLNFKM